MTNGDGANGNGANGNGKWPKTLRRFLWDIGPACSAPPNDGIVAPEEKIPPWIDQVALLPDSLEVVRRARQDAEDRAKTAEDKAARLVQTVLVLLTIALALGSYQLEFTLKHTRYWVFGLIPIALAIVCFALSAFEALQIDRVGMYSMPVGWELEGLDAADARTRILRAEEYGKMLAGWTAKNKHTDLMQARAWMSRGLAALLIAGVFAGITRALPEPALAQHHGKSSANGARVTAPRLNPNRSTAGTEPVGSSTPQLTNAHL